jgi:hypothetical protein
MASAAVAGSLAATAAAAAGVAIAGAAFPQAGHATPTTAFLAIAVSIGFCGSIAAGYLTARFAPGDRLLMTMALLMGMFLGAAVVLARGFPSAAGRTPMGFLPLVALLAVIGAWAGAMTERAVRGAARSR